MQMPELRRKVSQEQREIRELDREGPGRKGGGERKKRV